MVIFQEKNMINSQVEFGHFDQNKLNALKEGWKLNIFTLAGDHPIFSGMLLMCVMLMQARCLPGTHFPLNRESWRKLPTYA